MTDGRRYALEMMVNGATTHYLRDQHTCLIALQACRDDDERREVRRWIVEGRLRWLDWLTVTQRKWQAHTRREARANHHDSVATRERYVRCSS